MRTRGPQLLCLDVRTDEGRSQLHCSLEQLSGEQRRFLRGVVEVARRGGSVSFSLEPGEEGEMKLSFSLREPPRKIENAVKRAIALQ